MVWYGDMHKTLEPDIRTVPQNRAYSYHSLNAIGYASDTTSDRVRGRVICVGSTHLLEQLSPPWLVEQSLCRQRRAGTRRERALYWNEEWECDNNSQERERGGAKVVCMCDISEDMSTITVYQKC